LSEDEWAQLADMLNVMGDAFSVQNQETTQPGPPTGRRVFAAMIDLCFVFLVSSVVFSDLHAGISEDAEEGNPLIGGWHLTVAMVIGAPYYLLSEVAFGRTVGKALLGLKVASLEGHFSRRRVLVRNLVRVLWAFPILGGYLLPMDAILIWMTSRHQSLGDLVAGTTVVRAPLFRRHALAATHTPP
jgi:uncharacterized RDD family membrane protein YckC